MIDTMSVKNYVEYLKTLKDDFEIKTEIDLLDSMHDYVQLNNYLYKQLDKSTANQIGLYNIYSNIFNMPINANVNKTIKGIYYGELKSLDVYCYFDNRGRIYNLLEPQHEVILNAIKEYKNG